jgi:hypothetical protein
MSAGVQVSPQRSEEEPNDILVSELGIAVPVALFVVPWTPALTNTAELSCPEELRLFLFTVTVMPLIVAPLGILKPKFDAYSVSEIALAPGEFVVSAPSLAVIFPGTFQVDEPSAISVPDEGKLVGAPVDPVTLDQLPEGMALQEPKAPRSAYCSLKLWVPAETDALGFIS